MRVLKFGGGCLKNPQELPKIIERIQEHLQSNLPLLIVFSAIDKTTSQLEQVVSAYYDSKDSEKAHILFSEILQQHLAYAGVYLQNQPELRQKLEQELLWITDELTLILDAEPVRERAYYYDQIVCLGEILATTLFSFLCKHIFDLPHLCVDTRDFLRSNADFSRAKIDYELSQKQISENLVPLLHAQKPIFLQGFIASTAENESTTLGKEGSDFSASLFANFLNAEAVYLYKDVPGIMEADPKSYPHAQTIKQLSYEQMEQIAQLGTQVIHSQTLIPLKSKAIPLYVLSFLNPELAHTSISHNPANLENPICVRQDAQTLIRITNCDIPQTAEILQEIAQLFGTKIKFLQWQEGKICLIIHGTDYQSLSKIFKRSQAEAEIWEGYSIINIIGSEEVGVEKYLAGLTWEKSWHNENPHSENLHSYLLRTADLPQISTRKNLKTYAENH